MKDYSKNYLSYLKGRVQLIFTEMYESDICDEDIRFAAKGLNECLRYIHMYEEGDDDIIISTFASTIAEYCEEFGVTFNPPSKYNIKDTSGSVKSSSKQTRTLRTMVRGEHYELGGDVYEYLGYGEISKLHTLRKNGEDNVVRMTEDRGYIFTEVEPSSYQTEVYERWADIVEHQHIPKVQPKSNPDSVEKTEDNYLLLLG